MPQGDGFIFNNLKEQLLRKQIDLVNDTLKVALIGAGWTQTIDGATLSYSDVSAFELSGTGYTAGGVTLSGKAVAQDDTNNRASFDANDPAWTGLNAGTPAVAFLYDDTTTPKHGIAYWLVTTPTNGGDYTLQLGANGIILLT